MTRRRTSSRRSAKSTNRIITVAVAVLVLVVMALTCPDKQQHEDAVKEKMSHVMKQTVNENLGSNPILNLVSNTVINGGLDFALGQNFCVKDYLLFSVGRFHDLEDEERALSFGIFNHVFTPSEARMRRAIDEQRDNFLNNIKSETERR